MFPKKFKCEDEIQFRLIKNLTNKEIITYNHEGNLILLGPIHKDLVPSFEYGIVYVVDSETYKKLKRIGRTTDDLCHTTHPSRARGEIRIVYLESYDIKVDNTFIQYRPATMFAYEKNDPCGTFHQFLD